MTLLVSAVQSAFSRRKRDITDVPIATFAEWCDFANKFIYRKLVNLDPERFVKTQSYTISNSPETENLPSDFKHIKPEGCGFYYIDNNSEPTSTPLTRTGYGSVLRGFYITGTTVVFTGIESSETYTLRYIPTQTKIDAVTDYFTTDTLVTGTEIIPDEYLEMLVNDLDVLYNQWDEDTTSESLADFRFMRTLDEMLEDIRKEPDAYNIPDPVSNF